MNKIRCIVVDDEPLARRGLEGYIEKIAFLEWEGSFKNALKANEFLMDNEVDLIFLDIEMPEISGIHFLKTHKNLPSVIFTTAYSEYALESYDFDVVDYLVKPISFERFLQAANKASYVRSKREPNQDELDSFIFVKTDQGLERVMLNEILFVQSMQNYITIFTEHKKLLTLVPLKSFMELLSSNHFVQVHKSYVVSKSKVEGIKGNQIIMGVHKIPISERMRKEVMLALTENKLLRK